MDYAAFLKNLQNNKDGRSLAVLYCVMFNKAPDNIINAIAVQGKLTENFNKWVKIYQSKF